MELHRNTHIPSTTDIRPRLADVLAYLVSLKGVGHP